MQDSALWYSASAPPPPSKAGLELEYGLTHPHGHSLSSIRMHVQEQLMDSTMTNMPLPARATYMSAVMDVATLHSPRPNPLAHSSPCLICPLTLWMRSPSLSLSSCLRWDTKQCASTAVPLLAAILMSDKMLDEGNRRPPFDLSWCPSEASK
ncbi:hypothetical protein BD413DRAFT_78287 [Trametes elegans]|nr:hypothetical protein BD413DRAFT_78287 [Trametes elegans]